MTQKIGLINLQLAVITGIIVAGLSIYRGFSLFIIIMRGVFSFLLIYVLGCILILLWQKVSPKPNSPEKDDQEKNSSFDFIVGEDLADQNLGHEDKKQTKVNDSKLAGQINMEGLNKQKSL
ncbi:MAG: hypothetical protein ACOX47_00475 [Bacillota bacterium]|jgi:hypothetical protein